MARSLYPPHLTYLDIYILLTFLITGCHALADSDEIGGVIAGAVVACVILIAAIAVIVYCIMKVQNSKKLQKQEMNRVHQEMNYGTRVLRKIPTGQRGYPSIIEYSDYMVGYQPPIQGHPMSMVSRVATISHMPMGRPPLDQGFYSIPRPPRAVSSPRAKSIGDRHSKQKSRSRSKKPGSPSRERESRYDERWDQTRSQYILRKKDESDFQTKPAATVNEPYSLTSLFSKNTVPTDPYPKTEEPRITEIPPAPLSDPSTYTNDQQTSEEPIVYPPKLSQSIKYSHKIDRPAVILPDVTKVQDKVAADAIRPDYPDYDLESVMNEDVFPKDNVPKYDIPTYDVPKYDAPIKDVPSPKPNKFSYAFTDELKQSSRFRASNYNISEPVANPITEELKQSSRFRASSYDISEPVANPFTEELKQSSRFRASNYSISNPVANPLGASTKQVQFNSVSADDIHSVVDVPVSYIPPAPPLHFS